MKTLRVIYTAFLKDNTFFLHVIYLLIEKILHINVRYNFFYTLYLLLQRIFINIIIQRFFLRDLFVINFVRKYTSIHNDVSNHRRFRAYESF